MGLMADLGYTYESSNRFQTLIQQLAASRSGAWVFEKTLYRLDKPVFRATGGRHTVPSLLAGLPVLMLTTTGARSGETRTSPLIGVPYGSDLALIGSNWGQEATPGWVYNLEADPSATVGYRDRSVRVVARRADDALASAVFEAAAEIYTGYASYRERAAHRTIRVFILEDDSSAV